MAIDPRAAAAAAQAAADAARAAAEAAAAESDGGLAQGGIKELSTAEAVVAQASVLAAAEAAVGAGSDAEAAAGSTAMDGVATTPISPESAGTAAPVALPTLANLAPRQVLDDSGVTLRSELAGDAAGLADLGHDQSALAVQGRGGFAALPGLPTDLSGAGGIELPTLEGSFSSGGGDIDKSDVAIWGSVYRAIDTVGDVVSAVGKWAEKEFDGPPPDTAVDGGTADLDEASGGEEGASDPDLDAGSPEAEEAAAEDEANSSGGTAGADAGGGSDRPSEDAPFVPPKGWVDPDDLGLGIGGAVVGSKGGALAEVENLSFGPYGDNTVVNYGSEGGPVTAGSGPLRDLTAANWVGQPVQDTDAAPLDRAKLEELSLRDDDEVINPGGAEQADASTQASTAYLAPEGAHSPNPSGDGADGALPVEPMDLGAGLPAFEAESDARGDASHGRGREFGQEQGQAHGHVQSHEQEV